MGDQLSLISLESVPVRMTDVTVFTAQIVGPTHTSPWKTAGGRHPAWSWMGKGNRGSNARQLTHGAVSPQRVRGPNTPVGPGRPVKLGLFPCLSASNPAANVRPRPRNGGLKARKF